jgi:hypothetical protein
MQRILKRCLIVAAAVSAVLLITPGVLAQGCAMCYNNAAATGPQAQAALRHGILILGIPPTLMFAGMVGMLYRRRNLHHEAFRPAPTSVSARSSVSEIVLHLD